MLDLNQILFSTRTWFPGAGNHLYLVQTDCAAFAMEGVKISTEVLDPLRSLCFMAVFVTGHEGGPVF